jgi:hypothetical protein
MSTTVQQILDAAHARSTKNDPGLIATQATELLKVVIRAMQGIYAYAARINPTFFAEQIDVPFAAGGWLRPSLAESIWRIEDPTLAEVVVVPYDDRVKAEPTIPAVYEFGQKFRPATALAPNPQGGSLTFFYAKRPADPANLAANLDALWTEQYNELLIDEVAIYLALKDGRMDELSILRSEREPWVARFTAFLEHATANERRRFSQVRRFNTNTIVPLRSLLAGGEGGQ